MTLTAPAPPAEVSDVTAASCLPSDDLLHAMGSAAQGLSADDAAQRLARWGPNAVSSHRARFLPVLWHQLRSPLLGLLLAGATASFFVGEKSDAVIIGVIVAL